jgi:hypothetical protein
MPEREKKIEEILQEAAAAVAAAKVPEDLRSVAFGKAVDLIVEVPTASDARMTGEQRPRQEQRKTGSTDDPIGMISGKFET